MVGKEGQQIDHYRLVRLLKRESDIETYFAVHVHLPTSVTIKVFLGPFSDASREKILAWAHNIMQLNHAHIVYILNCFSIDKDIFLIVANKDFNTFHQRYPYNTHHPFKNTLSYARQIADALSYAHHQKVMHGDIQPENLLIDMNDDISITGFLPPIILQKAFAFEQSGTNSVAYKAPEQFGVNGRILPASDQYALGVIIYEWLSGARPFTGSREDIIVKHQLAVPPPLTLSSSGVTFEMEQVVMRALAKDPNQRYPDIKIFVDALYQAVPPNLKQMISMRDSGTLSVSSLSTEKRRGRQIGSSFSIWYVAGLLLLLLLIVSVGFLSPGMFVGPHQPASPTSSTQTIADIDQMTPSDRYNYITKRAPILDDLLDGSTTNQWDTTHRDRDGGGCFFSERALHVVVSKSDELPLCFIHKTTYTNFAFQVNIKFLKSGKNAGAGLFFRSNSTMPALYRFFVETIDYSYTFDTEVPRKLVTTNSSGSISTIHPGSNQWNLLTVIAKGSDFYLYINTKFVDKVTDNTYPSGAIGLFASRVDNASTDVAFQNLKVWIL